MRDSEIPKHVWDDCTVRNSEVTYHRMDIIWAHIAQMNNPTVQAPRFLLLSKIASLVLTLPHSNADAERVFSLVRLNKTAFRNSLSLDGTLSSILTVKLALPESKVKCYAFEPPKEVVTKSKKVTWSYNKEHKS